MSSTKLVRGLIKFVFVGSGLVPCPVRDLVLRSDIDVAA